MLALPDWRNIEGVADASGHRGPHGSSSGLPAAKSDIILLQRRPGGRTEEQRLLMAAGLWDLDVEQILAEVKVTQSLNERIFAKAYRYDDSYLEYADLELHQLRTVIISSITPKKSLLTSYSFQSIGMNGVYENQPIFGRTL
ncbi:MAG: hypothetical protein HQL74_12345, partial [Magnetococcales bacterium]|nr:hypothetical protein [Magnetococcales bacterium]